MNNGTAFIRPGHSKPRQHRPRSVAVFGTAFDNVTMDEAIIEIERLIEEGGTHQVATANSDFLAKTARNQELRKMLLECDLVLADGMPIVWASCLLGAPLKDRVTGADLVPRLFELSRRKKYRLFVLGTRAETSRRLQASIDGHLSGAQIVGLVGTPGVPNRAESFDEYCRGVRAMDDVAVVAEIHRARPDILLVAFGHPLDEQWIYKYRQALGVPVCIGVGSALDFLVGVANRAPRWMQAAGLEWFHRLLKNPSRLGPRYASDAVCMLQFLALQLVARAIGDSGSADGSVGVDHEGGSTLLTVEGALRGSSINRLLDAATAALEAGVHVTIDLKRASGIDAEGLGTLLVLTGLANRRGLPFRLTGVGRRLKTVFRLARAWPLLRSSSDVTLQQLP